MPNTTDTVKAILTPGEFVIRKEAVDMIGVPTLEKLNDMPEAGGHSEIDRLIAQATLKNMTGMYGGGMVKAEQYGTGGMVNQYQNGGQAMSNLKPVPDNNPGLAKLPENVRNKMGYMQDGGSVLDMALRRAEPTNFLEEMLSYEPSMAGGMNTSPERDLFGRTREGQVYGKDILRPHEEKYLDHYNAEYTRAKNNLIGFLPEDRELMFEFLNRSGMYDDDGEESIFKNNPNFKIPKEDKALARQLMGIEEKIDKRRYDLEKRIRVDSASGVPSQLDKYPSNLLKEEERKELFGLREKIRNSKSYQSMEDDQSRLYGNRQRMEIQERRRQKGEEINRPVEEYKSLFGFDPSRDRRDLGEDPREYEGEVPNMYDLLEKNRKNFYSQYQKPRTGLLDLLGFMKGGMAKKEKEMYSYEDGGLSGYQDGGQPQQDDAQVQAMMQQQAMMQREQPSPFVPFDQRPPSSGDTMSSIPMGMQQGDYMRSLRGELEMENKELTRDKMQNFLERLRLDSLSEKLENSMFEEPSMSRADSISDRDLMEFLKLQDMKRGSDATIQGMNNNPEGLFR